MKSVLKVNGLRPRGHYSLALEHNGLVFISGQLSKDLETGESRPGTLEEETRRTLANIEAILKEVGSGKDKVLKTTAFVSSNDDWPAVNRCYEEFFGEHRPARSIVPVKELSGGLKVEIEVIASLN